MKKIIFYCLVGWFRLIDEEKMITTRSHREPSVDLFSISTEEDSVSPIAPVWTPDSMAANCRVCHSEFTFLNRKFV